MAGQAPRTWGADNDEGRLTMDGVLGALTAEQEQLVAGGCRRPVDNATVTHIGAGRMMHVWTCGCRQIHDLPRVMGGFMEVVVAERVHCRVWLPAE